MQIGLAKTPTMHGGIGSAEVGFTQCTFFFLTALTPRHTYACNALPLTFTPSPCISLSRIGNTHTNSQRKDQREREGGVCYFCVIWFLSCWVKLPSPWQWRAPSRKKKGAGGREGNDKGSLQGRGGCQSRKEVLGAACRAVSNGGGGKRLACRFL